MKLELTLNEQVLLLDSIYTRIRKIDQLIETFESGELKDVYRKEQAALISLQSKIENQYETKAI